MTELELLKRKIERERKARLQAEAILEQKSLEVYEVNQQLQKFNEELEKEIAERNQELVSSEVRYRTLVETAQDIIYNISVDGHFLFINSRAKDLFGYEEEEIVGRYFLDLIPEQHREEVYTYYRKFIESEENKSYLEFPVLRKDGQIRWVGQSVSRVTAENNTFLSAYARDITTRIEGDKALKIAREALEKSETKYRSMIENMELGILEVDMDGIITNAYDRFCKMTGYSREELIGQNANELLLTQESKDEMDRQHLLRKQNISASYEAQIIRKDGKVIWVIISGAPFYDELGNIAGTAGIHYDITAEKELQEELQKAREKTEQAQKAEQQFLASMSHEIRTPLNAIIGMSHLLSESELNDEQRELLQIVVHSSGLLHSLINDILDISKIDSGNVNVKNEPFDLIELLDSIRKTFDLKAREKNVQVVLQVDGELNKQVYGDPLLLNQVMMNLVGNAEKFTESGEVKIKLGINPEGNNVRLRFQISDTGIGISPEQISIIFDKFKQAGSGINKQYGGTGLGLTITKKLLELMDSEITVESEPGKGSTFSFDLVLQLSDRAIKSTGDRSAQWLLPELNSEYKILVAEDNALNQKYLGILLDKAGISYDIAENGKEALLLAKDQYYPLILMDLQMPEMDGFEATKLIRSLPRYAESSIVALTAMTMRRDEIDVEKIGLNDFLTKPFTPQDLYSMLSEHLGISDKPTQSEHTSESFEFSNELDVEYLANLYGDDAEYALDIFESFLNNYEEHITRLKEYIATTSLKEAVALVHKIKPTYGMVGMTNLSEQLRKIEQKGNNNNPGFFDDLKDFLKKDENAHPLLKEETARLRKYVDNQT